MQLKMSDTFNFEMVEKILLEEDKYISDIFSNMPLSMSEPDSNEDEEEENSQMQNARKVNLSLTDKTPKRAQTFEELHERLNELKSQGKLDYRGRNIKKGLKNRIKKKSKKEERRVNKKFARAEQLNAAGMKVKEENGETSKVPKQKPIFNSEGHMVFSKFDFSQVGAKRKVKTTKNPTKILQQIEQKKQKVKELVESGEVQKAEEIKEKDAWNTVLAKARGEKVKDDLELLKKSIKREEQKKKVSAKKWESRSESVQKAIQEKQEKRQENILKRKRDKKTNHLKKAAKRGRIIPGF